MTGVRLSLSVLGCGGAEALPGTHGESAARGSCHLMPLSALSHFGARKNAQALLASPLSGLFRSMDKNGAARRSGASRDRRGLILEVRARVSESRRRRDGGRHEQPPPPQKRHSLLFRSPQPVAAGVGMAGCIQLLSSLSRFGAVLT